MRVLVCPDKFGGTLSAPKVAAALAQGWARSAPDDVLVLRALADGGPGFLDVLAGALDGERQPVPTVDPLGRPVIGAILLVGPTAYVESAQACGLDLLAAGERQPMVTSSYGLGVLVAAAMRAGAHEIVIGLGGSATNDAGAGLLTALGAAPVDARGRLLPPGGAALAACAGLTGVPDLDGVRILAASDVDSPLTGPDGASAVFGPQKGALPRDVRVLDEALAHFAIVLSRLPTCPTGLMRKPGGGAAGGLGAAVLALGGELVSGVGLVSELTGLDAAMDECDLVVTGEGSFDSQSFRGKAVAGVAAAARERGLPCVVVAGRAAVDPVEARAGGVSTVYTLVEHFGDTETAMRRPAEGLVALGERIAAEYRPS